MSLLNKNGNVHYACINLGKAQPIDDNKKTAKTRKKPRWSHCANKEQAFGRHLPTLTIGGESGFCSALVWIAKYINKITCISHKFSSKKGRYVIILILGLLLRSKICNNAGM